MGITLTVGRKAKKSFLIFFDCSLNLCLGYISLFSHLEINSIM